MRNIREPVNFYTHVIPALLSVPAMLVLLQRSDNRAERTAALVYGLCTVLLFLISALYHGYPSTEKGIRFWQKIDHCSIYLMIAGSYTPTSLLVFDGGLRWALFGIVWFIAAAGCFLKIFNRLRHNGLSLAIYIAMGCLIIPLVNEMLKTLPFAALGWMLLGGAFYIGGTWFYYRDRPMNRYFHTHELWHLFVVAGAACHYIYNYRYLFPA